MMKIVVVPELYMLFDRCLLSLTEKIRNDLALVILKFQRKLNNAFIASH